MSNSQKDKYRIILADDHPVYRAGVRSLIEKNTDIAIVAEANDGQELLELLSNTKCDLIILDLSMPKINGLEALAEIKRNYSQCKVIIVTMHNNNGFLKKAVALGVDGYVLKEDIVENIIKSIQEIRNDEHFFSSKPMTSILNNFIDDKERQDEVYLKLLTKRETRVLELVASGYRSNDIADDLNISKRTVDVHRANIMEKLEVDNIVDLIKFAIKNKIVDI